VARSVKISEEVDGAQCRAPHLPLASLEIATLKVRHCAAAVDQKDFLEFTIDKSLTIDLKDLVGECLCGVSSHHPNLQNVAPIRGLRENLFFIGSRPTRGDWDG